MADRPVVAVACSGGRDSVALLHAAVRTSHALGTSVVALHVHHGLMADADRWASEVQALCERWNIGFACEHLAGAPAGGESVEAWARRERYRALARLARNAGAGIVLLGHHLHDQAETVLLQALRGAGPAGLAAMPRIAERDGLTWARPWIARTGAEIDAYVAPLALHVALDPSNTDPRFARSRLRHEVMPALRRAFPDADGALASVARRAGEARAVLDEVAADDLARLGAADTLPIGPWRALSSARQANALRGWLKRMLDTGIPQTMIDRMLRELHEDAQGTWLVDGRVLGAGRGVLSVMPPASRMIPLSRMIELVGLPLSLLRCDAYPVPEWGGTLEVFATGECGIAPHRLAHIKARIRSGGEQFQLKPRSTPRSLKKQYQALGVAIQDRNGPLLYDAFGTLLYVPGLGIDAREWAGAGVPQWGVRYVAPAPKAKAEPV